MNSLFGYACEHIVSGTQRYFHISQLVRVNIQGFGTCTWDDNMRVLGTSLMSLNPKRSVVLGGSEYGLLLA